MELNCRNGRECIEELGPVWSLSRSDLLAEASDLMAVRHRRWGALQGHRAVRSGEVAFMAWLARPGYPDHMGCVSGLQPEQEDDQSFRSNIPRLSRSEHNVLGVGTVQCTESTCLPP